MFTPLNVKTYYSFLSSTISLEGYISVAKNMGYKNIGIMDQANLHAAYSFIKLANKSDLNPIIGLEASLLLDGYQQQFTLLQKIQQDIRIYSKFQQNIIMDVGTLRIFLIIWII